MKIKPRCRVCDAPVEFFGDLCADDQTFETDGLIEIVKADIARLSDPFTEWEGF